MSMLGIVSCAEDARRIQAAERLMGGHWAARFILGGAFGSKGTGLLPLCMSGEQARSGCPMHRWPEASGTVGRRPVAGRQ